MAAPRRSLATNVAHFVSARLAEDEQDCLDARLGRRYHDPEFGLALTSVLGSVFAEVTAVKRWSAAPPTRKLLLLASVWSDHPDFRPGWRL